jgi:capsule polysaccharide modification protein KpsS
MVDSGDEFFYKNFIDTFSYDESDDDFLTEVALLIHEHNVT